MGQDHWANGIDEVVQRYTESIETSLILHVSNPELCQKKTTEDERRWKLKFCPREDDDVDGQTRKMEMEGEDTEEGKRWQLLHSSTPSGCPWCPQHLGQQKASRGLGGEGAKPDRV